MTVYDHVMNDVRLGQLAAGLMLDATAEGDIAQLNRVLTVKRGLQSARSQLVSQHAEIVKHRKRYAEMQARIAHLERELHYAVWGHMPDDDEDGEPLVDESSIRTWGELA